MKNRKLKWWTVVFATLLTANVAAHPHPASCAPSPRDEFTATWTGSEWLVWGGTMARGAGRESFADGARYDPGQDAWTPMARAGAPRGRSLHTAVWTGRELIVWGGVGDERPFADGARYDSVRDTWTPISPAGAPSARLLHTAVWTGDAMLVFGGWNQSHELADGARYDPATDTWSPLPEAPAPRRMHSSVWTGAEMLVWGGYRDSDPLSSGMAFNPKTNRWRPIAPSDAPFGWGRALWAGDQLLVWGSAQESAVADVGFRYVPQSDLWTTVAANGAPAPRRINSLVWTGREAIVWAGFGAGTGDAPDRNDGGRWSAADNTWRPIATAGAPTPRRMPTATWTGRQMLVWGGRSGGNVLADGGRYDPVTDRWAPIGTACAPH